MLSGFDYLLAHPQLNVRVVNCSFSANTVFDTNDPVNVATKILTDRGVKMYGAWWCPHCVEQKEKFGASFEFVPYVECGIKGDLHGRSQACRDANIEHYPTWQFPPTGERVERIFSLQELSDRTGCALP